MQRRVSALLVTGGRLVRTSDLIYTVISHTRSRACVCCAVAHSYRSGACAVMPHLAVISWSRQVSSPKPLCNLCLNGTETLGKFFPSTITALLSLQLVHFTSLLVHPEPFHRRNGIDIRLRSSPKGYILPSSGNTSSPRVRPRYVGTLH